MRSCDTVLVLTVVVVVLFIAAAIVVGVTLSNNSSRPDVVEISSLAAVAAQQGIPKIIWTYWNSDKLPLFIQACVESWKRYHPDFNVRVLTPSNLKKYTDLDVKKISWNDKPARESDIIRLDILAKYGGIWSDASIVLFAPYPFLDKMDTHDFICYYLEKFTTDMRYPVIESWFFASVPQGKFIDAWRKAFMDTSHSHDVDARVSHHARNGVDFQNIDAPNYLYIHIAAQYALQKVMTPEDMKHMYFLKAEDGPYKYLVDNGWQNEVSVKHMLSNKSKYPMNKLRGCERGYVSDDESRKILNGDALLAPSP